MARQRSPHFPSIGLGDAIERVREVFAKERTNYATRVIIAKALGYNGISGTSAKLIGTLRQYGLLTGRGENLRVSEDAIEILHAPSTTVTYRDAIKRAAYSPELFSEINSHFSDGMPSPENLHYFLVKRGFSADAVKDASGAFFGTQLFLREVLGKEVEVQTSPDVAPGVSTTDGSASLSGGGGLAVTGQMALGTHQHSMHVERTVLSEGVTVELRFNIEPKLEDFEALADYAEFRMKRLRKMSGPTAE